MVEQVDVLICGSGSAGLCAAAYLARCGLRCKVIESRSGPLERGQADGVQCRTVEVYESFGLAEDILRQSYHVIEDTFWSSDESGGIVRTGRSADTQPGLSHMPHLILNQAIMNRVLIDAMKKWNDQEVEYGVTVKNVIVDSEAALADQNSYCVTVTTENGGKEGMIKAKYALGCDGAHSTVRRSLGHKMIGDSSDAVWGVMDCYPRTNFPDIRRKVVLQTNKGNLLIIPREGGSLVRFYIELPHGVVANMVTLQDLQAEARKIFHPYKMDFADTYWWSAYSIGQRTADFFSKDNRVFLTGDACHTHSPKAGQGMNTSLQDGYNIGWKLAAVLKGQSPPSILTTYNLEREKVAHDLINFDREFSRMWKSKKEGCEDGDAGKAVLVEYFLKSARYTAGLTAQYGQSVITNHQESTQDLAKNLVTGMRFPTAQVVRFCDAKAMPLVQALPADGRWRIVVFAGDITTSGRNDSRLAMIASYLESSEGPIKMYTPQASYIDSFIEPLLVLSGSRVDLEQESIPSIFTPITGPWGMKDLHKVYFDDESYNSGHGHAYESYDIDPAKGAIVVVRPDQYVSLVTELENTHLVSAFFAGFAMAQK